MSSIQYDTINKETIQVGSTIYAFPRLKHENNKSYFIRKNFFIKSAPSTEKEYVEAIQKSLVESFTKTLGCTYS